MSHELTVEVGYAVGQLDVRFEGDSYPNDWNDLEATARQQVEQALYDVADIHEWRDSFETAQEYSMPGMSPEPEVGTVVVDDDGNIEINLEIDSIHDCNWDGH